MTAVLAGLRRGQELRRDVDADPIGALLAGVRAPGGCGKTALLDAVGAAYRAAGVPVASMGTRSRQDPTADAAVLVDDAQQLDRAVLEQVVELARTPGRRLVVAFRPWPRRPELVELEEVLRQSRPVVVLDHLDRAGVVDRATALLGGAPPPAPLIELLIAQTGGQPLLVDALVTELQATGTLHRPDPVEVAPRLRQRLGDDLRDLEPAQRDLLLALAVGAPAEPEVLAAALGPGAPSVDDVLAAVRATGYLLPSGRPIPLVTDVLLAVAGHERTVRSRLALLPAMRARGREVVGLARSLAAAGVKDAEVSAVLVSAADERVGEDPELARTLYEEGVAAGAPAAEVAVRRARAAALTGRADEALRLADLVLGDATRPDLAAAIEVAATVLSHRGLLGRAADLHRWLGPARAGETADLAALTLLGTGDREAAAEHLRMALERPAPTMAAGVRTLMAQGVHESVTGSAAVALATLTRAAALLEPAGRSELLPDSPAALAALIGISNGDLDIAEAVLRRALGTDLGGVLLRPRHHVLLAWIAMLRGDVPAARAFLASVQQGSSALEGRDELFVLALEVGIARRTSDVPMLVRASAAAREALVRHSVDVFALLPLGELAVAAARLEDTARLTPHLDEAWQLLGRLGEPVLWATPLHWYGLQAAILAESPAELEPHAAALVHASSTSDVAAVLADAGRAWVHLLRGEIDPEAVMSAARALQTIGLAWDGSRLLGQAAARTRDRRAMTTLLQAARGLQGTVDAMPPPPADPDASDGTSADPGRGLLSGRELELVELLLEGRTYREIGDTLYISPKTVEHHVARMKQRLGASGRSDLFVRLRTLVSG